jgi:hypothetical protein
VVATDYIGPRCIKYRRKSNNYGDLRTYSDVNGLYNGARSRNRTGTVLPPRDFKSLASTNFAIRAYLVDGLSLLIPTLKSLVAKALYSLV